MFSVQEQEVPVICKQCSEPLRMWYRVHHRLVDVPDERVQYVLEETDRDEVGLGYEGNGHFCSMHCGYAYGLKAVSKSE